MIRIAGGEATMIEPSAWLGFAAASFAVAIAPGPSWVYVISATLGQRRGAGFVAVLGNGTGIACHALAAALGLSAILHVSATALTVARWAGALYLIYLALRTVLQGTALEPGHGGEQRPMRRIFRDGLFVNLLNPKVSLLMLALLPQFLDPAVGRLPLQTILLGSLHVVIASLVLSTIVLTAGRAAATVRRRPGMQRALRWVSGTLLFGFGARMLIAGRSW
jgi:threonine/homoserine/homoserine lactone efflux protein